jgi:hypothetical protein
VSVLRSYDSAERIMGGTTKNGKACSVAVPPTVCRGLEMLAAVNPHGGDDPLVVWSDRTPDKPCDYKMIERGSGSRSAAPFILSKVLRGQKE